MRFSLRTMALGVGGLGAFFFGVMTKLLIESPEVFFQVLTLQLPKSCFSDGNCEQETTEGTENHADKLRCLCLLLSKSGCGHRPANILSTIVPFLLANGTILWLGGWY